MKRVILAAWCFGMVMSAQAGELWSVATVMSKHLGTETKFNEWNPGLGFEYHVNESVVIAAGRYKNSMDRKSSYLIGGWTPLHLGLVKAGVAVGAVNGYPMLNDGKMAPVAMGLVRVEGEKLGANVLVMPAFKGSPLTVGLQLKWRF